MRKRGAPSEVVVCGGVRTPYGRLAGALCRLTAQDLLATCLEALLRRQPRLSEAGLLAAGCAFPDASAPELSSAAARHAGFSALLETQTFQSGALSSCDAVLAAVRAIRCGDADLAIAGGADSLSRAPFAFRGSRDLRQLRSIKTVKSFWGTLLQDPDVAVVDALEEAGGDPLERLPAPAVAELWAQAHGATRKTQDDAVRASRDAAERAWAAGFYGDHVVAAGRGDTRLRRDECLSAEPGPETLLFDSARYNIEDFYNAYGRHLTRPEHPTATVTERHVAPRADGGAAVVLASEGRAQALGLPVLARVAAYGRAGGTGAPGSAPVRAAEAALARARRKFARLSLIELHEPVAASRAAVARAGAAAGQEWAGAFRAGRVNPRGGSLALGCAPGAEGARLLLNLAYGLAASSGSWGLLAAAGAGGSASALVLEAL